MARKLERCTEAFCEQILRRVSPDAREDVFHALRVLVEAMEEPCDTRA